MHSDTPKRDDRDDGALIQSIKDIQSRLPDRKTTAEMLKSHRESIRMALQVRGDPFSRNDWVVLRIRSGNIRIPIRDLPAVIGHDTEAATHVVAAKGISSAHFKLEADGPFLRLRDLDSTNGTFVNGRKVREEYLRVGDFVRFGIAEATVLRE